MKTKLANSPESALTLLEVIFLVGSAGIVLALFLVGSAFYQARHMASSVVCVNRLKEVGLAFRVFASDNMDRFPMLLSVTNGGSMEFAGDAKQVWRHFAVLSNSLSKPLIVKCPKDMLGRKEARSFAEFSSNAYLSYFVGLDADETTPNMLLAGDRNITNLVPTRFAYGLAQVGPLGTNHTAASGAGWDRNVHKHLGHVAFADGSVQRLSSEQLRERLRSTGDTNGNRIAVPD